MLTKLYPIVFATSDLSLFSIIFIFFSLEDMQFYPSSVGMLLLFILDLDFSRWSDNFKVIFVFFNLVLQQACHLDSRI